MKGGAEALWNFRRWRTERRPLAPHRERHAPPKDMSSISGKKGPCHPLTQRLGDVRNLHLDRLNHGWGVVDQVRFDCAQQSLPVPFSMPVKSTSILKGLSRASGRRSQESTAAVG